MLNVNQFRNKNLYYLMFVIYNSDKSQMSALVHWGLLSRLHLKSLNSCKLCRKLGNTNIRYFYWLNRDENHWKIEPRTNLWATGLVGPCSLRWKEHSSQALQYPQVQPWCAEASNRRVSVNRSPIKTLAILMLQKFWALSGLKTLIFCFKTS